jgi:hypothetical protein
VAELVGDVAHVVTAGAAEARGNAARSAVTFERLWLLKTRRGMTSRLSRSAEGGRDRLTDEGL